MHPKQTSLTLCHHVSMKNMNIHNMPVLSSAPHFNLCRCVFYLKGSQTELYEESGLCSRVFWQEGKHHVVHPEQRDEKQSGFGQSPAHTL